MNYNKIISLSFFFFFFFFNISLYNFVYLNQSEIFNFILFFSKRFFLFIHLGNVDMISVTINVPLPNCDVVQRCVNIHFQHLIILTVLWILYMKAWTSVQQSLGKS